MNASPSVPRLVGRLPAPCGSPPAARGRLILALLQLLAVAAAALPAAARAAGRSDTIAVTGQTVPGGDGRFGNLFYAYQNESGAATFSATLTGTSGGLSDTAGIYLDTPGGLVQVARAGQAAPDGNGVFSRQSFYATGVSDSGMVVFSGELTGTSGGTSDNFGYFSSAGGVIDQIVREGETVPGGDGSFGSISATNPNRRGGIAFRSGLNGTSGGTADDAGIFFAADGNLSQVVRKGQAAAGGDGTFSVFQGPLSVNNFGQVGFGATLAGTGLASDQVIYRGGNGGMIQLAREGQAAPGGGSFTDLNAWANSLNDAGQVAFSAGLSDGSGLYRAGDDGLVRIVRSGQAAPDGNGQFLDAPVRFVGLNEAGQVAFWAPLEGTMGGSTDNTGIFLGSGGSLTQIARRGQAAPVAGDIYTFFSALSRPNAAGQVAFAASVQDLDGVFRAGLFTSDGIDTLQVARTGDPVAGTTVTNVSITSAASLNEMGQIVYTAQTADFGSVVRRWTPDLRWRTAAGGGWDDSANWTLGLDPSLVHDVSIDPAASLTVAGPIDDTAVRSLTLGGGTGLATLALQRGGVLTAAEGVSIARTGILTGDGSIAGGVDNGGTIRADNLTIAGSLSNAELLQGSGRVAATQIINTAAGRIRALAGDSLWLSGSLTNNGLIEVNDAELRSDSQLSNAASGASLVSLRNGSLIALEGISNKGGIAATLGASSIQGDITNLGTIQVSGGAQMTFFGDLAQNGTFQVAAVGATTSTAVILGSFTGAGGFVGGGDLFALGDLRPGNSPASVGYGGNLFLGAATETFIELGGLEVGDYDQLLVSGDLGLAGSLSVSLIDGHTLGFNQTYLIGDVGGGLTGRFAGLDEGASVGSYGGVDLFISYAAGDGNDVSLFTGSGEIVIEVGSGRESQAAAGYPTIAAATSVTKTGAGTLVFDAANAFTGPTAVAAGTLEIADPGAVAGSSVTVDTAATLAVAAGTTLRSPAVIVDGGTLAASDLAVNSTTGVGSLAINAGTLAGSPLVTVDGGGQLSLAQDARVTVAVGGLSVAEGGSGGRIDLGAGEVRVAAGGITADALRADLIAGRNGGAWDGGTGIMSAAAAASAGTRTVGYVVAGDGSATVSFAAPGDTDLSGQVNVFDLVGIDSAGKFGSGAASVWSEGDFNYDGVTNVFDLIGVDSSGAYGAGNYFPASPVVLGGGSVAVVPEPALAGLAIATALGGLIRARRRGDPAPGSGGAVGGSPRGREPMAS